MTLALGRDSGGGRVLLSAEDRSWHVQVIGGSGRGKSSFLESLIRQDIVAGRGLCLIDPHGTLADDVVAWCASRRVGGLRRVHVINASDQEWSASFNPLRLDAASDPSARVDAMVSACAQVWGGEDANRTPLLRKCLTAVFYALAVRGLTLVEATELISATDPHRVRRTLTDGLPDPEFQRLWREFNSLSRAEFQDQFASAGSRLNLFLKSPSVRRMLGQTARCIDLRQVMDRSEIVIVNLAAKNSLSHDNARLLGTLLTSELFLTALARDRATAARRPFTLYIDECGDFLTDDIERMLDQTRKFGLHLVLAHQRLAQLRRRSSFIHDAVVGGTHSKVVFGGLMDEDAERMASELFRGSFDLERPKRILDKPVVVGEEPYWLETESSTRSAASTRSLAEGSAWGASASHSEGLSEQYGNDPETALDPFRTNLFVGAGTSTSRGESQVEGYAASEGRSDTSGRSQTLRAVRETMPTAVYSLDEERHRAIALLRGLSKRTAIVKLPHGAPIQITTDDVLPTASGRARSEQFVSAVRDASGFITSAPEADSEIASRLVELRTRKDRATDSEFWSE